VKDAEKYMKSQAVADMILAYKTFVDDGIDAVQRAYPQYKTFVLENKGKTVTQVKHELLNRSVTS
jgi:hypothetical protein